HPDDAPAALDVPEQAQDVRVMLALPRVRPGATDVQYEDEPDSLARYLVREAEVEDSGSMGLEPALLQLGRLRLRLMLETDLGEEWLGLGVVRVVERRADNRVVLDDRYIAPWLAAGSHPLLLGFTQELYGLLNARSEALAARLSQPGRGGVSEVSDFMLLETVNRYIGALWHVRQAEWLHPERLFHDWLMLACDLSTYTAASRRPEVLPEYAHDDLQATFGALMDELRRSLSAVLEQHALQIPLQDRGQGVRVAQIPDLELLRTAGFVLAVHADMPSDTVRSRFPAQVKIGPVERIRDRGHRPLPGPAVRADMPSDTVRSRFPAQVKIGPVERIRDLVHLQLPGVTVRALPVAPRQIPYSAGHVYFELDKGGDFWKQLERTGALALHLAGE